MLKISTTHIQLQRFV